MTQSQSQSPTYDLVEDEKKAYILFVAIGIGYLFPFSALTQPVDYWHDLFPDFNVEFSITVSYMWINLLVLAFLVFVGDKPIFKRRIYGGFYGQLIALLVVPTSYFFHFGENTNYVIIMGATAFAAIVTAFIDSCAISFAAQYPESIQAGLQLGIGVSTLIGSVYRLLTKALFPESMLVQSSLLYFYCGAATIVVCLFAYAALLRLPISKRVIRFGLSPQSEERARARRMVAMSTEMSTEMSSLSAGARGGGGGGSRQGYRSIEEGNKALRQHDTDTDTDKDQDPATTSGSGSGSTPPPVSKWEVLRSIASPLLVVFIVYFTSLALWPPLVTEIPSYNFPYLQETRWWSLLLLFDFAISDTLGRLVVNHRGILTKENIWLFAVLRVSALPLIVCSIKGWLFAHDFWSICFVSALGFSNGYLGSLAIIMVGEWVDIKNKGLAGTFTGFTLNAGLVAGATASIFVEDFVKGM